LQAGASSFLLKTVPPEELLAAIRVVAAGESVVAPRVTRRLLDRYAGQLAPAARPAGDRLAVLTDRESEVLELVAGGLSNTEIAERLNVAEATVKTHFGRILAKLDLRDRSRPSCSRTRWGWSAPEPDVATGADSVYDLSRTRAAARLCH
jgi:DNA-binding NarL/FixJ family response regulator